MNNKLLYFYNNLVPFFFLVGVIQCIDNKGNVLLNYDYNLNKPEPYENNKKYKNISCYKQQNLYIKNRFKN